MKYQNVILTLDFTLQYDHIWKRKMLRERRIEDQEISSFACFVTWRRLDNVQIKQTSYHIRNTVKYCVKIGYLNGKIPNGNEYTINVT